mgnify:CR=1 FL=1
MTIYDELVRVYPTTPPEELFASLGGQWPSLVGNPNYKNTCAIRMSVALNAAGYTIPAKFREGVTENGGNLIIKVRTMWDYMVETFGQPTWGMSKNPGTTVKIPAHEGVVVYHAAFADATGHFDLWSGTDFVGKGDMNDVASGFDLALWYS